MTALLQDVRFVLRTLAKSPGYACAALGILALGIGGVTAMFSTVYAVMIRPLPYSRPDRLVMGRTTFDGERGQFVSGADYADIRDACRSFSSLEAFGFFPSEVTVAVGGGVERARGHVATPGLLSTLGVGMSLGRPFTPDDGRDGATAVAIISYPYWQKHFGARRDILGQTLVIDGLPHELVGVAEPGFRFVLDTDMWLPLRPQGLGPRRYSNWFVLGRLKDGVSLSEAQSEVDVATAQLARAYPDTNAKRGLLLTPLQTAFAESHRSSFGLLCGGAGAILLIAWANAAGLLLARGALRQGELAVRVVMGASRARLIRLLLTESLVLACGAGAVGVVLAVGIQKGLLLLLPIDATLFREAGLSLPVLVFVVATTVLTGLAFGLLPALRDKQGRLLQNLRASGRGQQRQGLRSRSALVVAQVAASFALLVVAGLLTRSWTEVHQADLGFDSQNLLTVEVPLTPVDHSGPKRSLFFAQLLDGLRATPGVISAAAITQLPLRNPFNNVGIAAAGAAAANPEEGHNGYQRVVLPGYFQTMGIPILAGRDVQPTDTEHSLPVVVLSQQIAETLFKGRDPLGQRVVIDGATDRAWEVVGVVRDVKQDDPYQEPRSRGSFYRAQAQQPHATMRLAIRTSGDPMAMVSSLRTLLQKMDPGVPLSGPRTMEAIRDNATVSAKAQALFLAGFSLLAVTLASVGLFGLLAYVVTQRRKEIGIRVALGAQAADVARPIVVEAMVLVGGGLVLGIPLALALGRLVRTQLFGVTPSDPLSFVAGAVLLLAVGLLAAGIPARRAAKVHPMVALRCD